MFSVNALFRAGQSSSALPRTRHHCHFLAVSETTTSFAADFMAASS
jgi:hypothetical protein